MIPDAPEPPEEWNSVPKAHPLPASHPRQVATTPPREKSRLGSRPQNQPKPRGMLHPPQVSGDWTKQTHKLSLDERALLIKVIARHGPRWTLVTQVFRQLTGQEIHPETAKRQARNRPEEVRKAKDAWLAELRGAYPLAIPTDRVGELSHQYGMCIRSLFRVPCATCLGSGIIVDQHTGNPLACPACFGRKWTLPAEIQPLLRRLEGDIRFETIQAVEELWALVPVDVNLDLFTKMQDLLTAIRAECGDHWSPREKNTNAEHQSQTNVVVLASSDPRWREQLKAMQVGAHPIPGQLALPLAIDE